LIFQKNDALLKEIEQLKEQYVIKFQEVSGKIDKCRYKVLWRIVVGISMEDVLMKRTEILFY